MKISLIWTVDAAYIDLTEGDGTSFGFLTDVILPRRVDRFT